MLKKKDIREKKTKKITKKPTKNNGESKNRKKQEQ